VKHVDYTIDQSSPDDDRYVSSQIVAFNAARVPFTQVEPFVRVGFALRVGGTELIGGVLALTYCWQCLYVDALWVSEEHRGRGYGAALLSRVESEARKMGCSLSHLDTFDFQAKDFYLAHGYEVFGTLDDCPPGHQRFFLKKRLVRVLDNA